MDNALPRVDDFLGHRRYGGGDRHYYLFDLDEFLRLFLGVR